MSTSRTQTVVTLDTPIVRGENKVTDIILTKPNSGALRGTSLSDLMSLDVAALCKVLPRITTPALTTQDVNNLEPSDLVQLGTAFLDFLLPNSARDDLPLE